MEILRLITKTCGNSPWLSFDHSCKFLFLAPGGFTFYLEIQCSQPPTPPPPPVCFFSEIAHSRSYTDSYISSFWWVVNILLRKFDTPSKKEMKMIKMYIIIWWKTTKKNSKKVYVYQYKAAFLSLLWTRSIDLWCNMFETLEIQRKYRR